MSGCTDGRTDGGYFTAPFNFQQGTNKHVYDGIGKIRMRHVCKQKILACGMLVLLVISLIFANFRQCAGNFGIIPLHLKL